MQTAPVNRDLKEEIRAIADEFERNVRARDADRLVNSFYAEDCRVLPPNHPMVQGLDATLKFWQGMFGMGLSDGSLESVEIEASGDLVYEIGRFKLELRTPAGESMHDNGKYIVLYRRQPDGSLKAIADMFSSDNPPAPQPA